MWMTGAAHVWMTGARVDDRHTSQAHVWMTGTRVYRVDGTVYNGGGECTFGYITVEGRTPVDNKAGSVVERSVVRFVEPYGDGDDWSAGAVKAGEQPALATEGLLGHPLGVQANAPNPASRTIWCRV